MAMGAPSGGLQCLFELPKKKAMKEKHENNDLIKSQNV
jgi:hypothetical protein